MQITVDTGTGWIEPQINNISGERRAKPRYDLHLPLRYKVLSGGGLAEGSGITRNLSSGGVAFEPSGEVQPGAHVELAIQWPVALEGGVPLKLVAHGQVAWYAGGVAAVCVKRCHFRTQRKAAASAGCALP